MSHRVLRGPGGRFRVGTAGGPGSEPVGRRTALKTLDDLLSEPGNITKLREALQKSFDANPLLFWRRFIGPLLSRSLIDGFEVEDAESVPSMIDMVARMDASIPRAPTMESSERSD